ncbi:MAG: hypothetical protein H6525_05320 [Actinobacteria bacterium]|nr:hypothetical protein [Actinomycetota bacterium]MCB9412251.1 hypothetical protein [Actinomycetota bacterium]
MSVPLPGDTTRWRCARCGNLTRFDVVRSRRTADYWHFDLAGEATVESSELLREVVEQVTCRWCGGDDAIELVARPDAGGPATEPER